MEFSTLSVLVAVLNFRKFWTPLPPTLCPIGILLFFTYHIYMGCVQPSGEHEFHIMSYMNESYMHVALSRKNKRIDGDIAWKEMGIWSLGSSRDRDGIFKAFLFWLNGTRFLTYRPANIENRRHFPFQTHGISIIWNMALIRYLYIPAPYVTLYPHPIPFQIWSAMLGSRLRI